jgi:hypothetical protein
MFRKRRPATRRCVHGACIVSAWIAVVYDLLAKIKERYGEIGIRGGAATTPGVI